MKRISLNDRLDPASNEVMVSTLARMSVADYYHGLSRLGLPASLRRGGLYVSIAGYVLPIRLRRR